MSPFSRLWITIKAKFNKLVNKVEDPAAQLDYAYEQMKGEVGDLREALVKLAAAKSKLSSLRQRREKEMLELQEAAKVALQKGNEEFARELLERKNAIAADLERLDRDIATMEREKEVMKAKVRELESQIEQFASNKEVTKAQLAAADATIAAGKATNSIGGAADSAGSVLERANEMVADRIAEADAITELEEEGVFTNISGESGLQRKMREMASESDVEADLQSLKAELGMTSTKVEEQESDVATATDAS